METETTDNDYWFAVGSFKFRNWKDLYDNIKGRTGSFKNKCAIVQGGKGLFTFPIRYEQAVPGSGKKERFIIEWEHETMALFNGSPGMSHDLKAYLPGFKRVGCTATGAMGRDKFYGYIDIAKLG